MLPPGMTRQENRAGDPYDEEERKEKKMKRRIEPPVAGKVLRGIFSHEHSSVTVPRDFFRRLTDEKALPAILGSAPGCTGKRSDHSNLSPR